MPALNPSLTPYLHLTEAAIQNACQFLEAAVGTFTDEYGQTLTLPIRSLYANERAAFPEVVVSVNLGVAKFQAGLNAMWHDDTGTQTFSYFHAPNSGIVFEVRARSDAERHYLADALIMTIASGYAVDQYGHALEGAVLSEFAFQGIFPTGFRPTHFPVAILSDARPMGQVFPATVTLECDIFITWAVPDPTMGTPIVVQPIVTADGSAQQSTNDKPLSVL